MVESESQIHHGADGDGIIDHDCFFGDGAQAENSHLRLVDDGCREKATEAAEVGKREGATRDFLRLQLFGAGAIGQIDHLPLQAGDVEFVGVADHGNDESTIERDGDTQVHFPVIDDILAFNRRIQGREDAQSFGGGAHDEGQEGETEAVAFLEGGFGLVAQLDDLGHVDAVDSGDMD